MKLYSFFRSSASFRVRIALNLKDIEYDLIPVKFRTAEHKTDAFLSKNPQGLLPTIEDGQNTVSQSLAIIEYLDAKYPNPKLLPLDELEKARVREISYAIACEIHPLNNLRVLKYLSSELGQVEETKNEWYRHWVQEGFEAIEKMVCPACDETPYCFGESITMADVCLIPQIWNANRFDCDLSAYPTLCKINDHLTKYPAFIKAAPENQPDAV